MSSYLEPSFLLELGAYAVAAAGIRIFKSKYWRNGVLPSANGTPHVEQPVATVQVSARSSCSPAMPSRQKIPLLIQVTVLPKPPYRTVQCDV